MMTTKAAQILKSSTSHCRFIPASSPTALSLPFIPSNHNSLSGIEIFRKQYASNPEVPICLENWNAPEKSPTPYNDTWNKIKKNESWERNAKNVEARVREISSSTQQSRKQGPQLRPGIIQHQLYEKLKKYEFSIMQYEYRSGGKTAEQRTKEIDFLTSQSKEHGFPLPYDINDSRKEFHRFNAPLKLVLGGNSDDESSVRIESLYIAQMPIEDLPPGMRELFPAPMDIIKCGKGDVYGTSIWIGNPPTYTPLHKDPNPNIFTQHLSCKVIRMLRPSLGTALFHKLQNELGTHSSASFRGEEMMEGPEYHALEKSIWNNEELEKSGLEHFETLLEPGESLFIPKGWWHSIKSVGMDLNMSVNWWFR